jgi:hypothetical protein
MNSTIEMAVRVVGELNQTNDSSYTKNGRHTSNKSKIRRVLKEK